MNIVALDEFLSQPEVTIRKATIGENTTVKLESGYAAVIIDEVEYTMLTQALKLCMEHPEWTITK